MNIETNPENLPFGSYGEFDTFGMPQTAAEWREYDAFVAAEIDRWDEEEAWAETFIPDESDFHSPF